MRERPIPCNGAMVRAVLAGQKAGTRSAVKASSLRFRGSGDLSGQSVTDHLTPELFYEPNTELPHFSKLISKDIERSLLARIRVVDSEAGNALGRSMLVNAVNDPSNKIVDVPAVADHCRKVRTQPIRQVVDLLDHHLCARKKRLLQRLQLITHVPPSANGQSGVGKECGNSALVLLNLRGKGYDFVQKQASENPSLAFPKIDRYLMLAGSDLGSLVGGLPRQCRDTGAKGSNRPCRYYTPRLPVDPTILAEPPALAHTIKYRHRAPSLLEPILP